MNSEQFHATSSLMAMSVCALLVMGCLGGAMASPVPDVEITEIDPGVYRTSPPHNHHPVAHLSHTGAASPAKRYFDIRTASVPHTSASPVPALARPDVQIAFADPSLSQSLLDPTEPSCPMENPMPSAPNVQEDNSAVPVAQPVSSLAPPPVAVPVPVRPDPVYAPMRPTGHISRW